MTLCVCVPTRTSSSCTTTSDRDSLPKNPAPARRGWVFYWGGAFVSGSGFQGPLRTAVPAVLGRVGTRARTKARSLGAQAFVNVNPAAQAENHPRGTRKYGWAGAGLRGPNVLVNEHLLSVGIEIFGRPTIHHLSSSQRVGFSTLGGQLSTLV